MVDRRSLQCAGGGSVSGFRCAERRSPGTIWLGTKSAEIFQLQRIRAIPEANRRTRRPGGQAGGSPALRLSERNSEPAERSRALSKIKEQRSVGRDPKF